jgi:hypothetical protein
MEPYSTLEVHHNQETVNNDLKKYPAGENYSDSPEVLPVEQQGYDHLQKVGVLNEDAAPEVYAAHQNYSAIHGQEDTYKATDGQPNEKVPERSICGVKRRTFFIILAVAAVIIIGAIAGGVAGAFARKNVSSGSSQTDTSTNVHIMDISSLSATNWTDPSGFKHKIVFFQDPYNSMLAQRWDSQNKTWESTNITQVMAASTTPLDVAPGTSIASASLEWSGAYGTHLWFLDSNHIIRSTYNLKDSPELWQNNTMNAQIVTYPGSKIAATWQRCAKTDCVGSWVVAYQRPGDGQVETANQTNYNVATDVVDGNAVAGNTSLAIIPQYMGKQEGLGIVSQSYSSSTSGSIQLSTYNNVTGWKMNSKLFHTRKLGTIIRVYIVVFVLHY